MFKPTRSSGTPRRTRGLSSSSATPSGCGWNTTGFETPALRPIAHGVGEIRGLRRPVPRRVRLPPQLAAGSVSLQGSHCPGSGTVRPERPRCGRPAFRQYLPRDVHRCRVDADVLHPAAGASRTTYSHSTVPTLRTPRGTTATWDWRPGTICGFPTGWSAPPINSARLAA